MKLASYRYSERAQQLLHVSLRKLIISNFPLVWRSPDCSGLDMK